jgi:hypothetical protein
VTILTPKGYSRARQPRNEETEQPAPPVQPEQPAPDVTPLPGEPQSPQQPPRQQIRLTFPPQTVGINCPNCGTPYPAQVFSVVDAGQDPVLKSLMLSGQLNMAICPRCGAGGPLTTPLLYHDPEHQFLGVFVPQQIPVNEQQKVIGDLSRRLMNGLPQDARRGYMLTPKQFLSFQSLLEAVLEHEGVTREMLDKQRRQIQLIEQAAMALQDAEGLKRLVSERDAEMDDEFFTLLGMLIDSSASGNDAASARQLAELRERLIELTTWGKGVQKQRAAVAQLRPGMTVAELVDLVAAADDLRVVDALTLAGRPLINYAFFQELTNRIETAQARNDAGEAKRLADLRQHMVEFGQRLDEVERATMQQYSALLGEILQANDIQQAVAERAPYIDQNFLSVLSANLQQAENRGASAAVRRLKEVWDAAVDMINHASPPEVQLVNQLLLAEYPGETRKLLAEHRDMVTADFIEALSELAEQMEAEDAPDMATRLRQIRSQAQLMR